MKYLTISKHKGINRFANRLNMPKDWLYSILNGYLDKENNIQQRNGITKYNATKIDIWTLEYLCNEEPDAATPVWVLNGTDYASVSAGILTIDTVTPGGTARCYYTRAWSASNTSGYAVEVKMKVVTSTDTDYRLTVQGQDGTYRWTLYFSTSEIELSQVSGGTTTYAMDTTDAYHVYTIKAKGTVITVEVDGVARLNATLTTSTPNNEILFGDAESGTGKNSKSEWDYVKYYLGDNTANPTLRTLYECRFDDGDRRMITRAGDGWHKEDGDAVWDDLDVGRTVDAQGMAAMFSNVLIMVDGATPRKCTYASGSFGTPANLGGTPPSDASAIHVHNHHCILNSDANPLKVYVSALNNAEDYTTADDALTLDLRTYIPEGDKIIGFATFAEDLLVIIMKRHLVLYNAPEDVTHWSLNQIINVGAVSGMATSTYVGQVFMPTLSGVDSIATMTQTLEAEQDDITHSISPYYRALLAEATSSNLKYICGVINHSLNHLYISIPNATTPIILVYSFDHKAVVGWFTGYTATCFCEREDGTVLVGSTNGYAYKMNEGTTDDGTAISFAIETPYHYFTDVDRYKIMRDLKCTIEHDGALTFYIDYGWDTQGAMTQISKTIASVSLGRTIIKEQGFLGRGRACYFKFSHATSGRIINIPQWTYGFITEGMK